MNILKRVLTISLLSVLATVLISESKTLNPDSALDKLQKGNMRFISGNLLHPNLDSKRRDETHSNGQHPFATVIACSDSRVPVETIFDQGIGDIFTIRVAGNVCDTDEVGSIEYGVDHLETPIFVVLGHTNCGAVTAVATDVELHGSIPKLVDNIKPAVNKTRHDHPELNGEDIVPYAVKANVYQSIEDLFNSSEATRDRVRAGSLEVVGAIYNIKSGKVEWIGNHPNQAKLIAVASSHASHTTSLNNKNSSSHLSSTHQIVKSKKNFSRLLPFFAFAIIIGALVVMILRKSILRDTEGIEHKKITVGSKLLVGYGILIVIIVLISTITIVKLSKIGSEIEHIAEVEVDIITYITQIEKGQLEQVICLEKASKYSEMSGDLAKIEMQKAIEEFSSIGNQIDRIFNDAVKILSEKEVYTIEDVEVIQEVVNHLGIINQEHSHFEDYANETFVLLEAGKIHEAEGKEENLEKEAEDLDNEIGEFLEECEARLSQTSLNAEKDEKSAELLVIILSLVGSIFALIFGLIITNMITKPLMAIVDIANSISKGKLDSEIDINASDEIGVLADSFRNMSETLKAKASVANEIASGNLKEIIQVISDEDVLGKSMALMRDNLQNLQQDLAQTISMQKMGDLDSRCNPENFEGSYAELLSGINDVLDAVINPVYEGMEILEQYGDGIIDKQMRELPGKQIVLTNGLNNIRENLQKLIAEGTMLSTEALDGNLQIRGNEAMFKGGYYEIISGFNKTLDSILKPIHESSQVLEEMASGNLDTEVIGDYKGDHAKIKNALNSTLDAINNILLQIDNAVQQVSSGAGQVSSSSQTLSEGATEQASSLEETTSSLSQVDSQTKQNAENAEKANLLVDETRQAADECNDRMKKMVLSMNEIEDSSTEISKIIKVIDEIAFQTNLLALNAAVEAARAGIHGKGFAVVAEEVRNLAKRSAVAAQETTELIEGSIKNVNQGAKIADETADSLDEIIQRISQVNSFVRDITSSSREQSAAISQISEALSQIENVTQSNTCNAEEGAAAAEELSSQSVQLKQMVAQFNLRDSGKNDLLSYSVENAVSHLALSGNGNGNGRNGNNKNKIHEEIITIDDTDFDDF